MLYTHHKHDECSGTELLNDKNQTVATISGSTPEALTLILAAPNLLKAAIAFGDALSDNYFDSHLCRDEYEALQDAIAKATDQHLSAAA